jgi:hypothetical protein
MQPVHAEKRTWRGPLPWPFWLWPHTLVLVVLAGLALPMQADTKLIRLRSENITTAPPVRAGAVQPQADTAPVSGLFLVQFEDRLEAAWRDQLRASRVELLRYVPEDAFVAHLDRVRLSQLKALPFVRWVGEYRPEHKVHASLRAPANLGGAPAAPGVSLLLSPLATPAERAAAQQAFASVQDSQRTRFGTIVRGRVKAGRLEALAASAGVLWIEPAAKMKLNDEVASRIVGGDGPEGSNRTAMQELGFTGRGVIVDVADSGLNNGDAATMHRDLAGRVDAFWFYGGLENAADEHSHGTHVAGIVAANGATGERDENGFLYGLGVAPEAHLVAQRIFDADGQDYLPPLRVLTRDAVRSGAVIGSNSWGDDTQGRYDLNAAAFDALVRDADDETPGEQPYVLEFSAGNAGPGAQTVGSPAVAKNVIATGASDNDRPDMFIYADGVDVVADFSSRGPCEDGRFKPDLVAPGTWIASLQSASAPDDNAWLPISENYQFQGGTSQAGPHVSGAAAVFVQYYRETHGGATPSPALVKAALINSAQDMDDELGGTEPVPNMDEGWGRVNLANLIGAERRFVFFDQAVLLTNRQTFEHHLLVGAAREPLKITLAYTDVPGFPAAVPALVNDLDLEVIGPEGVVYRGNQFNAGESIPGAETADSINNVEAVHFLDPRAGEYVVRVRARNVVEDVHQQTNAAPRQDFALVISGDLPLPGVGVVLTDRGAYNAPSQIQLRVIDFDLARQPSVNVTVRSTLEPGGLALTLAAYGAGGVFTGAVETATGPVVADARLHVRHGDVITVEYQDASPAALRTATATADFVAPVISGVGSSARFAKAFISWDTDEPATGAVLYGPDGNLGSRAVATTLETHHELVLDNLPPGVPTFFAVVATDEAGNSSTNRNGGAFFTVTPEAAPTVLVVDAYVDPFGLFDIPVSTYTDPLDQAGLSYEVWDVAAEGRTPRLGDLKPFRIVMWRVPELTASLGTADVRAISDYVNGGGGFFMASMEVLTRLEESGLTGFRKNVLHVESFETDPGVPGVAGVGNLSLTSGMSMDLDYSAYPDLIIISPDISDTFLPTTNAAPILFDSASGQPVGLRYPRTGEESAGRVIFLSFPLDTVPLEGPSPNNRVELVRNIASFLAPGVSGFASLELDRTEYSLPARVVVELADSDLAGRGQATVRVFTDPLPNGVEVTLPETTQPGQFRGALTLVADTNAVSAGQFQARDGYQVRVRYEDTSAARSLIVAAGVETSPPVISDVAAEADYAEALITWTTSKPANSLVQFADTAFPFPVNRTAYDPALAEAHEVALADLLPDHRYYFQIVSQDAAGNTTTDDNHGAFYTFHTLKPLSPPLVEDFERETFAWLVANDDVAEEISSILDTAVWQRGRPQNSLSRGAHSGANAWGTNLRGDANDYSNTSLISPAIGLTGGNLATLRFWHNYDFTLNADEGDIYELGGVFVSTNNGAGWTLLEQYDQSSDDWEEVELDLSPYVGKVVRLGWAYGLFSFATLPHPGWLVDDVSITMTTVERGTIVVSNNLAQARFRLAGPLAATNSGWGLTVTNAPPGTYVVTYEPVGFYSTPPPQTNALTADATIRFQGTYAFADVNHNGISDAWELALLGAVAPDHPAGADTDGDGSTDLAEFIGGTDPTDARSALRLEPPALQANRTVRLAWPAVVGRAYRLELSSDLVTWLPASEWLIATSTSASVVLPPLTGGAGHYFRLEVRP